MRTHFLWCAYQCPTCYWFRIWRFYVCQRNNKLVWDETVKIMNGLFNEVWEGKDVISLDHTLEITLAVCVLLVHGLYSPFSLNLNLRLLSLSSVSQVIAIWLLSQRMFNNYRIWAANIMEGGQNHTKGTPDVNERSTPHRLYGHFHEGLIPRLDFETYETAGFC